jgi:hypothetical protein
LFYTDLGVVECPVDETEAKDRPTTCSEALGIALSLIESVACGKFATHAAAARSLGLSPERGHQYRILARLDADLQQEVLSGRVDEHTVNRLLAVASLANQQAQRAAFAQLLAEAPKPGRLVQSIAAISAHARTEPSEPKRVRCVAYFNPEIFARQRWLAQGTLRELATCLQEVNQRLANPSSHLKAKGAIRLLEDRLRHHDLLNTFELTADEVGTDSRPQLRLTLDEQKWRQRRSFDGFTVLVAHPELKRSAADLCRTYRAKDAVETDFQVIKSLVKLRPVRHRTEVKVRAHVTLCMLALYVQRELTLKLGKAGISAALALEELEPCRLSLYGGRNARDDAYVLPQTSPEQTVILRRLGLTRLVDQRELVAALTPRSEFVSTEPDEVA